MEPIYGTNKKYLQSIAGSDYYRSPSTLRPMASEYASYQNTLGRRSTLVGPYTHMSKYSYPTDLSVSSHYGYTSWGLWRDSRNLSSALYAKKQKNIKSFSILLMSAAFIVVLAVLCVAGLAFYFSTFKTDLSGSILAFDCTFRVARGDIYTTGLRSNSTPVYRQKTAFYEKLIDTSLERSGLTVSRAEIMSFGDGPTIVLSFRVFLDMRKIKITINNVEEHIRTAFLSEVLNPNSAFKSIRIDPDSIEIKRLLDQDVLKTALLTRHEAFPPTVVKPGQSGAEHDGRHVTKKSGVIEKTIHKFTPRVPPHTGGGGGGGASGLPPLVEAESDIDMDNLPVIQGSFEITKTDADITQKRKGSGAGEPPPTVPRPAPPPPPPAPLPTTASPARGGQDKPVGPKSKYETATAKIEKMDKHGATTKKIKTTQAGGGGGRRSSTATATTTKTAHPKSGVRSTTTTTTPAATTTTSTTTVAPPLSVTVAASSSTTGKTPSPVTGTTSRMTTVRYQVLASLAANAVNETSSSASSSSSAEWDEQQLVDMAGPGAYDVDQLPPAAIGVDPSADEGVKNDTLLLGNIFQAIINDSTPEELTPARRRLGVDSIPKLDVNLFTSAPVLDKQPWHPISHQQQQQPESAELPAKSVAQRTGLPARKKPSLAEEILYRNRPSDIESALAYTENPNGPITYYQSYTNPSFGSSTLGIEPLGVLDVRPYPLPVDKIHEEMVPDFKYLAPTAVDATEQLLNPTLDEQKFEHLGDGVIAKKPDLSGPKDEPVAATTTEAIETTSLVSLDAQSSDETASTEGPYYGSGELNATLDEEQLMMDVAMDLAESRLSPDEEVTTTMLPSPVTTLTSAEDITEPTGSATVPSTTEFGVPSSEERDNDSQEVITVPSDSVLTAGRPSTTYVEVETFKYSPPTVPPPTPTQPALFPITKWEFVNGTRRTTAEKPPTRKVFNETLQALVVENVAPEATTTPVLPRLPAGAANLLTDLKVNRSQNLQNLSDIFDTLASKLGIRPEVSSKLPPFSSLAKIKHRNPANRTAGKPRPTTSPSTTSTGRPKRKKTRPATTGFPEMTTPMSRVIPTVTNDEIEDAVPVMLETVSSESAEPPAVPVVIGQAEVEVIDPSIYEEMLSSLALAASVPERTQGPTTTPPAPPSTLVTLLPVKSNSGIRNFRPKTKRPPAPATATVLGAGRRQGDKTESRNPPATAAAADEPTVDLKLMDANKTADEAASVHRGSGRPPARAGSNKNNTMVETVVRASMRFES